MANGTSAVKRALSPVWWKDRVRQGAVYFIIGAFVFLPLLWNGASLANLLYDSCIWTSHGQDREDANDNKSVSSNASELNNGVDLSHQDHDNLQNPKINSPVKDHEVKFMDNVHPDLNISLQTVNSHRSKRSKKRTKAEMIPKDSGKDKAEMIPKDSGKDEEQPEMRQEERCVHTSTILFSTALFMLHTLLIIFAGFYSSRSLCHIARFCCCGKFVSKDPIPNERVIDKSLVTAITDHRCSEQIDPEKHSAVFKKIKSLVENTWIYHKSNRVGRDSILLKHKQICVKSILKINNTKLWKTYSREKLMIPEHSKCKELLDKPILTEATTSSSQSVAIQMENDTTLGGQEANTLLEESNNFKHSQQSVLDQGEVYLFHGTKIQNVPSLIENGFDLCKYSKVGLYGKAIYLAESSEKADQYADPVRERRRSCLTMIVVRVVLGRISCHTDSSHPPRPPYRGVMGMRNQHGYDTIVTATNKRFREFLIFDPRQCYPEYVVIYDRV